MKLRVKIDGTSRSRVGSEYSEPKIQRFVNPKCENANIKKLIAGAFELINAFHIVRYVPSKDSHEPVESNKFVSRTHSHDINRQAYECEQ